MTLALSDSTLDRTDGSHSVAAAAHRDRCAKPLTQELGRRPGSAFVALLFDHCNEPRGRNPQARCVAGSRPVLAYLHATTVAVPSDPSTPRENPALVRYYRLRRHGDGARNRLIRREARS